MPVLHQTNQPMAWADWFAGAGIAAPAAFPGPRFEHVAMLSRAAVTGAGVALVPACLVEDELASGLLMALLPNTPSNRVSFYLGVPHAKAAAPAVRAFTEWITQPAQSIRTSKPLAARQRR